MASVPVPCPGTYPHHYESYLKAVPPGDLVDLLEDQQGQLQAFARQVSELREDHAYAPGKWTLKEVVVHMIDTERVMAYRLFCIARGEEASLPGFDQDSYVATAQVRDRSLASLVDEAAAVRAATLALLTHLPAEAYTRIGSANHHLVSAAAIAHVLYGHFQHHLEVLRTRYQD